MSHNQAENLALARNGRKENFYPITWELLFDIDNGMARHAKQMACERFGYDCNVVVDEAKAIGALNRFKAFTIGICTRVKNEGPYLAEWINFHYLAGVAKFYMWYDDSDDGTYQTLKNFEKMGIVRVYNITMLPGHEPGSQPFPHAEHSFRDACITMNPDKVRWMAFVDADEFLFPSNRMNLAEHFDDACPASVTHVAVRNRFFGTSGHATRPQGKLLIEAYQQYNSYVLGGNGQKRVVHKMIANTNCVTAMATHYPTQVRNNSECVPIYSVGGALKKIEEDIAPSKPPQGDGDPEADEEEDKDEKDEFQRWKEQVHDDCSKKLRLNHYVTKSREEFLDKYKKGKLSQSNTERELGIDRNAFVGAFGMSFIEGGIEAMTQQFKGQFGHEPAPGSGNLWERAFLRFRSEFLYKDGDKSKDDNILKYAFFLRQDLTDGINSRHRIRHRPLTGL